MAAANTDKFKKLSRKWTGQIGAGGVVSDVVTTIPLSSATNLPTDTAVVVTIDRVDVNGTATPTLEESVIGVVSGSNLVSCTRGAEGTAQAHSAGAVVEVLVNAKTWNDMIDGYLAEHSQLGVHASGLVTTLKATGAVVDTGTSDVTIVTPKAIADASVLAKLAGTQTFTGAKTFGAGLLIATKPVINGTNPTAATYTPATGSQTVALDCAANNMHVVTGHASGTAITFTVANATNSQPFIVSILQGAVVSTIAGWFATVRWEGGTTPTLTPTVAKRDTFGFIRTGANTYDGFVIGQNC
jgi:hypothetical protein